MNPCADILAMLAFCRRHYRRDALSSRSEADTTFNPYTNVLRIAMRPVSLPADPVMSESAARIAA